VLAEKISQLRCIAGILVSHRRDVRCTTALPPRRLEDAEVMSAVKR